MKKISSKELNDLSVDQKLDMIMHALGILAEPGLCVPGSVVDGHKITAGGLKEDKLRAGLKAIDEKQTSAKRDTVFIVNSANALEELFERHKDDPELTAELRKIFVKVSDEDLVSPDLLKKIRMSVFGCDHAL